MLAAMFRAYVFDLVIGEGIKEVACKRKCETNEWEWTVLFLFADPCLLILFCITFTLQAN